MPKSSYVTLVEARAARPLRKSSGEAHAVAVRHRVCFFCLLLYFFNVVLAYICVVVIAAADVSALC